MKKVAALLALVLASAALVACGDDDGTTTTPTDTGGEATNGAATEGGGGGGASTIQIEADPEGGLAFTTDSISAKAGDVTIDFKNPQPVGHDADVEDESGKIVGETDVISESSDTGEIKDLKPGKYVYFCSVPGHREGGMEGTLTVE
jgi:plastocyanin